MYKMYYENSMRLHPHLNIRYCALTGQIVVFA
jgi:hypothetical protein